MTVTVILEPTLTEGLAPKPWPLSVTLVVAPIGPFAGEMPVILGVTVIWPATTPGMLRSLHGGMSLFAASEKEALMPALPGLRQLTTPWPVTLATVAFEEDQPLVGTLNGPYMTPLQSLVSSNGVKGGARIAYGAGE